MASALSCFILAMVRYPEVQRKAQAEIDKIAIDRFPDFNDHEKLPYISAVCKETHRWHPVGPLGVAHALTHDDGESFILVNYGVMEI
jgi:cytochrome P450